jgi:predicted DNA binding protein
MSFFLYFIVMWRTKVRFKHRCLFGDNCEKAGVVCINVSFNSYRKGRYYFVYHFGTVYGDNYKEFLNLLKNDKRVDYIEMDSRTFIAVEKRAFREVPGMYVTPELIYIKPVYVDERGYETWELAAIKKETLMGFINRFKDVELFRLERTKLRDVYFPRLSPDLTQHQRDALELAVKEGYYQFPKNTDLNKLARKVKLSKSAFREHLKRAEMKVLGLLE